MIQMPPLGGIFLCLRNALAVKALNVPQFGLHRSAAHTADHLPHPVQHGFRHAHVLAADLVHGILNIRS